MRCWYRGSALDEFSKGRVFESRPYILLSNFRFNIVKVLRTRNFVPNICFLIVANDIIFL